MSSYSILDIMSQKALAEGYAGGPNEAMAVVGGIYAQCQKELSPEDFEKIIKVSGIQVRCKFSPSILSEHTLLS